MIVVSGDPALLPRFALSQASILQHIAKPFPFLFLLPCLPQTI